MSEEDLPKLCECSDPCSSDSSETSDEEMWLEEEDEAEVTRGLFDDKTFLSLEEAVADLKTSFNFDLAELKRKHSMDCYSYIKMINFVRHKHLTSPAQLFDSAGNPLWLSDEYLKPAGDFESWLSYDFDQLTVGEKPDKVSELRQTIRELQDQIVQTFDEKEVMKAAYKRLMASDSGPSTSSRPVAKKGVENGVASVSLDRDNGYFESYSHFGIHHSMLSDKVRTESYRDALLKNSATIKDKVVMDLGCGTSILSMFASQAGAKTVYAVDQSEIIYQAMEIAQTNGFSNIKFVKGRLEDVEFPTKDKVDVIVSEWMGYFLLFEGMLDSVIYARDNYLKPGGLLLPNRCTISLVGYGSEERYQNFVEFFHNVYGFNMKCMLKDILREGHVEKCEGKHVVTKPNMICDLDLMTCNLTYSNFTFNFNLEVTKDSKMTSFVGYFDTYFDLPEKVFFSTSPDSEPTHWQQVVFYLDQPVEVKAGDIVIGKFICKRDRNDLRSLNIEIRAFNKVFKYDLN